MDEFKVCIKCGAKKEITEFSYRTDTKKYRNTCKECKKKEQKEWRELHQDDIKKYREVNKEHIKEVSRIYYINHSEHLKQYTREYYSKNTEKALQSTRVWRENNKEHLKEYNHQYGLVNSENILNSHREYNKKNKNEINAKRRAYNKRRKQLDPLFKFREQVRHLITHSFTRRGYKKNTRTYEILGCDYDTLIKHLKETFRNNYGYEWDEIEPVQVDHIIPISMAGSEKGVIKLCYYKNLQLLKAEDNLKKRDNLDYTVEKSG